MANVTLTAGSVEAIMSGVMVKSPVMQVLGFKKIAGAQSIDRYRLLLSDGDCSHSSAMLGTHLNDKVTSGELDNNSVIRIDRYTCNVVQGDKKVLILVDIEVLASGSAVGGKIGNPQPIRLTGGEKSSGPSNVKSEPNTNGPTLNKSSVSVAGSGSDVNHNSRPVAAAAPSSSSVSAFPKNAPPAQNSNSNSFYGSNQKQPSTTARPVGKPPSAGPGPTGEVPSNVHPIASLTPYQNRWTIKARVTQKSSIRSWSNSRGEGTLFDMTLLDESGEIRATAFKNEVDRFYNLIEVNKVYYVRKAVLKAANKQYSTTNNDYDMTFTSETEVIPCDDEGDLPTVTFNFVPINQLESHGANDNVDVIGIVKDVDDVKSIVGKQSGKEVKKRDVTLVDESKVQVRLTLWGSDAENFNGGGHPILAVKGCRVSDWGGRSLSSSMQSRIILNPDIPESHRLRGWFDSVGQSVDYVEYKREGGLGAGGSGSNTNWKNFSEVKAQNLGHDKPDYFTSKATFVFMRKENSMYQACPQPDCNKKVVDQGNGNYRCEKCQQNFTEYKWRMILSANVADISDNQWVTCFQDTAEAVLGKKADEIGYLKDNDTAGYDRLFSEATFKSFILRMRAKMETFNDESRLKTVCVQATPVNYVEYNKKLISDIEALLGPV